jgi:hypothetical protein
MAIFIAVSSNCLARDPKLRIREYDLSAISTVDRLQARVELTRIFRKAGIAISWETGRSSAREAHDLDTSPKRICPVVEPAQPLVVRVIPRTPTDSVPGALGQSLPFACYGVRVTIFGDRVQKVAGRAGVSMPKLRACALAHEIGHVLLRFRDPPHSEAGVMRGIWHRSDYDLIERGVCEFTDADAAVMRATLLSEGLHERPSQ